MYAMNTESNTMASKKGLSAIAKKTMDIIAYINVTLLNFLAKRVFKFKKFTNKYI